MFNAVSQPKYFIKTYGCQMNEYDSEAIEGMLCERNFIPASSEADADVIVLNTCSVRNLAEQKVLGKAGLLGKLKRTKPNLVLAITGCMAQNMKSNLLDRLPALDLVCGPNDIYQLPDLIERALQGERKKVWVHDNSLNVMNADIPKRRGNPLSAWVSVMRGCNHSCTFCIVPHVRGKEVSRPPEDILKEVRQLVASGFKEITLLGQNINAYGRDLKENRINFPELLERIHDVDGLYRIRFLTSHPVDIREDLMGAMANLEKVCGYLHFPVQSGSNRILALMKRGYTKESYIKTVEKLRSIVPDVAISTDIIVGFPGETDEDFEQTQDVMKCIGFDAAYIFKYSIRSGTPAAIMPEQVPEPLKIERHARLLELFETEALAKNQRFIGKEVEVLIEKKSDRFEGRLQGRTKDNRIVYLNGNADSIGTFVRSRIARVSPFALYQDPI
ncbi:MAG: tRNA (N6-isopentenyl adenosine(37)-C2)-methylthiotransferase MiaB [Chlamydiota bacterium]|nr:tRNA (N6-isopentenyl adenosine(37)-C2)-methylthiotransferase MiaB [Chlamydiota bacterium]